jgi:hypothetical protein
MASQKARPSLVALAKQIESLTPKTRRAERGFGYEMRKFKSLLRAEMRLVRSEVRRHRHALRVAIMATLRRWRRPAASA